MTDAELAAETGAFYERAAERASLCARCPPAGGACAAHACCIPEGRRLAWSDRRVVSVPCERWPEFELRDSLRRSGVPESHLSCTFSGYDLQAQPRNKDAFDATVQWAQAVLSGAHPWLLLTGHAGAGKTHLAVAALRNLRKHDHHLRMWYADADILHSPLKAFFQDRDLEDPLWLARKCHVLVLDSVDSSNASFVLDELSRLLNERAAEQKPTMVLAREDGPQKGQKHAKIMGYLSRARALRGAEWHTLRAA